MTAPAEVLTLRGAQDELERAAEEHVAHRRGCSQPGCAECKALAATVLRWMGQAGLMRFSQAAGDEPGAP